MLTCKISLEGLAESQHGQVKYASAFADEHIQDIALDRMATLSLRITLRMATKVLLNGFSV